MKLQLNFAELQGTKQQYDNVGAHAEVMKMMSRGDRLTVRFGAKDDVPYAWVESRLVSGFKYELDNERFTNLLHYLFTGEVNSYNGDPNHSEKLDEGQDYQMDVMKQFIEAGMILQYTPLFREYNERISAMKAMPKGTIYFRIPRTNENLEYLREQNQPI